MRTRLLLPALLLVTACFKSGSRGGAEAPTNKTTAPRGPDYSATLADPVGFLPIDSEIVLSLDAEQLRQSPVWAMIEPSLMKAAGNDLQMFRTVCGFDPVTSIRGITVGIKGLKQETPDGILVVSGLDRVQMTACMDKARGADKTVTVAANGTVTIAAEGATDTPVMFAFVDASTVVAMIGPQTSDAAFAAALASGAPLRKSPAFLELIARVNLDAALWTVINGNSSVFEQAASLGVKPKAIFGSVNLANGLDAAIRVRLSTPAEAQQITAMVQGQIGMVSGFFEKLEITADDRDVSVIGVMTVAQLQSTASMMTGLMGQTP